MKRNPDSLLFDIDLDDLTYIQDAVGATEEQLIASYNRALKRTAVTIRKLARKHLKDELQLKNVKALRSRLKDYVIKQHGLTELKLWYGLNALPVSAFKGRMSQGSAGASFAPAGPSGRRHYKGSFVARMRNGKRSIWRRLSADRNHLTEERVDVHKGLQESVEDEVFDQLPDIFLAHLETDLKGRVKLGISNNYSR